LIAEGSSGSNGWTRVILCVPKWPWIRSRLGRILRFSFAPAVTFRFLQ